MPDAVRQDLGRVAADARRAGDILAALQLCLSEPGPSETVALDLLIERAITLCGVGGSVRIESDAPRGSVLGQVPEGDLLRLISLLLLGWDDGAPPNTVRCVADDGGAYWLVEVERPGVSANPCEGPAAHLLAAVTRDWGGQVRVETVGSGTLKLTLALPKIRVTKRPVPRPSSEARKAPGSWSGPASEGSGPTRRFRVLLLDDQEAVRRSVGRYLEFSGFDVVQEESSTAAVRRLQREEYDCVVSDYLMPDLDGKAFYEAALRQVPSLRDRIIFTTGDAGREEIANFLHTSGCPALEKPYDLRELVPLIQRMCLSAPGEVQAACA
jgi:CheY-like chemotaxis protein